MKLYAILIQNEDGFTEEHVIESDNRGVKGGVIPAHVLRYAKQYALQQNATRLEIAEMRPALLNGTGVIRPEWRGWGYVQYLYGEYGAQ